ncbi:MAG: type II toxin-antitoxin system VapC family toxin [Ardenticatenales bacterium]|nr:type II toxin-antitoxin system VapC family toxin [Ardenticatenales bacterium]
MSLVLLDTNVVSYLFKGDTRSAAYASLLQSHRLAISFMTVAELFEWAITRKWGQTRLMRLEQTLATYIIIPADVELCRHWGGLRAQLQAAGRTIAPQDAWIGATALRHQLPLITHNPSDFQHIVGLEVRSIIQP